MVNIDREEWLDGINVFIVSLGLEQRICFTHIVHIKKPLQNKPSSLATNNELINSTCNTNLAQGTVGLLIKEFNLICSRAGLFVRKAPGHLRKRTHVDAEFFFFMHV